MKHIKSFVCFCLSFILIAFSAVLCCFADTKNSQIFGDIDGDGIVSIIDASMIQKILTELILPDDLQLILADVDGDNKIDVKDVTFIQKYIAGISNICRVGQQYLSTQEETTISYEDDIADYVKTEAYSVADKVNSVTNDDAMVIAMTSDFHTDGEDQSASGVMHACQAINLISNKTPVDLVAFLGDIMPYKIEERCISGFEYADKCFAQINKNIPVLRLQGNHDEYAGIDVTLEAQLKYWEYIGSHNTNVTTDADNFFRNYGYRDCDDKKVRVIYLNSVDVSDLNNSSDTNISAVQFNWLINTALDFSEKSDESQWGIIVLTHHPLNIHGTAGKLLDLLDAYKGRCSGNIITDNISLPYDFTKSKAEFICHFHGHIHNYRVEAMGQNNILSITIPNACFGRNNEYGTAAAYNDNIRQLYGDSDNDGNQRVFYKTAGTAKDTSFCMVTIDRQSKCVYAHNYGTGIDRFYNYESGNELN